MRKLLAATTALTWMPFMAEAGEKRFFADVAVSSILIDRGEQIGPLTFEAGAGIEADVGAATVYGAIYRLTPIGGDADAFDQETDYSLGVAWERSGYSADVSANWLTYPGEESESSLELAASVSLGVAHAPTLAGFYDADFQDWGLELSAGPSWEAGRWEFYLLGRAGFVEPGDGAASRSYGGIEAGGARPVTGAVAFGFFARADVADEESFARRIDSGQISAVRNSGFAAGVSLSIIH